MNSGYFDILKETENKYENPNLLSLPYEINTIIISFFCSSFTIFSYSSSCSYFYSFFSHNPNNYAICHSIPFKMKNIEMLSSKKEYKYVSYVNCKGMKMVDAGMVMKMVNAFSNLSFLCLKGCFIDDNKRMFKYLGRIRKLNINKCVSIDERTFKYCYRKLMIELHPFKSIEAEFNSLSSKVKSYIEFDDCFNFLENINVLDIGYIKNISDNAFKYFKGKVKVLYMAHCHSITDKAFVYLKGIEKLVMIHNPQLTDKAIENLTGISSLDISYCPAITGLSFKYLKGIKVFKMRAITGDSIINDEDFKELGSSLISLNIKGFGKFSFVDYLPTTLSDKLFSSLKNIVEVNISRCSTLTDNSFKYFTNVKKLYMNDCNQDTISDNGFTNLKKVKHLEMKGCCQSSITDKAFTNLINVTYLDISFCNQPQITNKTFETLVVTFGKKIRYLDMRFCSQKTITRKVINYIQQIPLIRICGCYQLLNHDESDNNDTPNNTNSISFRFKNNL